MRPICYLLRDKLDHLFADRLPSEQQGLHSEVLLTNHKETLLTWKPQISHLDTQTLLGHATHPQEGKLQNAMAFDPYSSTHGSYNSAEFIFPDFPGENESFSLICLREIPMLAFNRLQSQ